MDKFGSAVILAGGKSSRMGFDKKNLIINNKRLLEILTIKLRTIFKEVILITNKSNNLDIFDNVSSDMIQSLGPLSGIYTGLKLAKSRYVYFIACDMPVLDESYINYMVDQLNNNVDAQVCITRYDKWIEPFNSFYSKDIADKIKDYLDTNRRSIYNFVKDLNTLYIDEDVARSFSEDFKMFYNLNTKEDINEFISYINKI